jgi:hypothetical protein
MAVIGGDGKRLWPYDAAIATFRSKISVIMQAVRVADTHEH